MNTEGAAAGCFQVWLLCEALLSFLLVFCLGQRLAGKKRLLRITSPCHTAVQWAEPGPSWEQLQAEHSELQNGDSDEARVAPDFYWIYDDMTFIIIY